MNTPSRVSQAFLATVISAGIFFWQSDVNVLQHVCILARVDENLIKEEKNGLRTWGRREGATAFRKRLLNSLLHSRKPTYVYENYRKNEKQDLFFFPNSGYFKVLILHFLSAPLKTFPFPNPNVI